MGPPNSIGIVLVLDYRFSDCALTMTQVSDLNMARRPVKGAPVEYQLVLFVHFFV